MFLGLCFVSRITEKQQRKPHIPHIHTLTRTLNLLHTCLQATPAGLSLDQSVTICHWPLSTPLCVQGSAQHGCVLVCNTVKQPFDRCIEDTAPSFYMTASSKSLIVTCLYVKQLGKDGETKECDGKTVAAMTQGWEKMEQNHIG